MAPWQRLVEKADSELAMLDIAEVNLLCGRGLPGLNEPEIRTAIGTIDHWASTTREFTQLAMPMFHSGENDYPESEPRFRIQAMITHLQRDLGIQYRHDRRQDDAIFEPADSFLQGILQGKGGTCASLPVLYAAVGRRLGYPLMLAETKGHLYARWDAEPGGESFNIEASGDGVSFFADEYFRTDRYEMPTETIEACGYLKSLSPRQEVASFLLQRGECWLQDEAFAEAALSFAFGNEADSSRPLNAFMLCQTLEKWDDVLRVTLPPRFPVLDLRLPRQKFRNLARELERDLIRLQVQDRLLHDPEHVRRWWTPLRENPNAVLSDLPKTLRLDFQWN